MTYSEHELEFTFANNNNNPIYKAPECQKTSVALKFMRIGVRLSMRCALLSLGLVSPGVATDGVIPIFS